METIRYSSDLAQSHTLLAVSAQPYAEPDVRWYAAYTCANQEKRVARQLNRRAVENFLPLYESVRRWKDRRVRLQLPLLQGYVFVRLALRDRLQVLTVPGVAALVGFAGHPAPIPNEDIETIRACLSGRRPTQPHPYVQQGERVRLFSGPLAGLTGIVVRQRSSTRFVISLELLQRSVAVEIDAADLVPRAAAYA